MARRLIAHMDFPYSLSPTWNGPENRAALWGGKMGDETLKLSRALVGAGRASAVIRDCGETFHSSENRCKAGAPWNWNYCTVHTVKRPPTPLPWQGCEASAMARWRQHAEERIERWRKE